MNDENVRVLYGGAKGGAKSFLLCVWVTMWVKCLIDRLKLERTKDPIALGFMGRKRSIDFHDTTLEDFKRVIPSPLYRLHDNEHEIIFLETAKVFCGGLDDPRRVEKFNSANYAFFAIDQAEETERSDVSVLQATLRLMHNGVQPPYKQLYTANPADCWLKEDFIDKQLPGHHFVPALYTDNPHLPDNYGDTLEEAFKHNEALLKAYKDGDWFALQSENALISSKMLQDLKEAHIYPKQVRRVIACDPSIGGDECVIYVLQNGKILEEVILHERDTMKIAGHMMMLGAQYHCPNFAVDVIGIGQGIADRLREIRPDAYVEAINSAEKAWDEIRFANRRAEMWWHVTEEIRERHVPFMEDEELRSQLTAMRFKVVNSNGKIQLEPKQDTKKRIGRSPDRADAFVYGLWTEPKTEPIKQEDAWLEPAMSHEIHGAVTGAMTA
jgi:hypothetical protein